MIIPQALDRLVDVQLASMMYVNNRKNFQASNPNIFLEHLQEKESVANALIPELIKLHHSASDQLEVKILYGQSGFTSNLETLVKSAAAFDKVIRIMGGAQSDYFYEAIGSWYENYLKLLEKYKVAKWQISPDSTSTAFKEKFAREKNTKLKTIGVGLSSPTLTRITPGMVSIEIYAKEIVIIQIFSEVVAQGYMESFGLLWKQAKLYRVK